MSIPVAILPERVHFESELKSPNECVVKYTNLNQLKQIFQQCKQGVKFRFENDYNIPDSERLFFFKYAKVNLEDSLEEIGLWNTTGLVVKFKLT